MFRRVSGTRRVVAAGLIALLVAPLLGAVHQHPSDHDGNTAHIEAAHGSHLATVIDPDPCLVVPQLVVPAGPPASTTPAVEARISRRWGLAAPEADHHPARAPPPQPPTRAPPPTSS